MTYLVLLFKVFVLLRKALVDVLVSSTQYVCALKSGVQRVNLVLEEPGNMSRQDFLTNSQFGSIPQHGGGKGGEILQDSFPMVGVQVHDFFERIDMIRTLGCSDKVLELGSVLRLRHLFRKSMAHLCCDLAFGRKNLVH